MQKDILIVSKGAFILCDLCWIYYESNQKEKLPEADNYLKYDSLSIKIVVLWI